MALAPRAQEPSSPRGLGAGNSTLRTRLAAWKHLSLGAGRAELRAHRSEVSNQGAHVSGAVLAASLIILGQIRVAERDARVLTRSDVPEVHHVDGLIRGDVRDREQEPRVDLAGHKLLPGSSRGIDVRDLKQRGCGHLAGGKVRADCRLVRGGPVGSYNADGDLRSPRAEGREHHRCPVDTEAAAEYLVDDRRHDHHGRGHGIRRGRPECAQVGERETRPPRGRYTSPGHRKRCRCG